MRSRIKIETIEPTRLSHIVAILGSLNVGFYILGLVEKTALFIGVILISVPLAFSIYARYAVASSVTNIQIIREIFGKPIEGYYNPVRLRVRNSGKYTLYYVNVEDSPPHDIKLRRFKGGSGILLPNSEIEILYYLVPRIGLRSFGEVKITLWDPLGLTKASATILPDGTRVLAGYPSKRIIMETRELKPLAEPYVSSSAKLLRGRGTEIYTIREFVEGDELRLIDWKATARLGKLYVKELRREAEIPLLIAVVLSSESVKGEPFRTQFEALLRASFALFVDAVNHGHSIAYIALTGKDPVKTPLGRGQDGLSKVSDAIAVTPLPGNGSPYNLSEIVKHVKTIFSTRGIIIIVADNESLSRTIDVARLLEEMRHKVYYLTIKNGSIRLLSFEELILEAQGESE